MLWQTLPLPVGGVLYLLPLLLQFWWIGKIEYLLVAFVFHVGWGFLFGFVFLNVLETGQNLLGKQGPSSKQDVDFEQTVVKSSETSAFVWVSYGADGVNSVRKHH